MNNRQGTILIVVLVIIMMVSLAAYHFTMAMESEHLATRNAGDHITARQCALSGIEIVAATLQQPRYNRDRLRMVANFPIDLWPTESEDESPYRVTISFKGAGPPSSIGGATLMDESAKLNLQKLLEWDQESPGLAREALLRLPGMDQSIADRLLDWIDSDSEPRSQDAEQGARNSLPLFVGELAFLQSEQSDGPAATNSGSQENDDQKEKDWPAWLNHLTVHSAERNESYDGYPRIFVNESDLVGLHRQLSESLLPTIADYIVLFRQYGAVAQDALPQSSAANNNDQPIDLTVPPSVEITDLTELVDSAVEVPTDEEVEGEETPPRVVSSPITLAAGASGGRPMDEILDALTLTKQKRVVGRVNVLTAPVGVLAAIPGLNEELAGKIISGRDSSNRSFRHPIGLLSSLSVDSTIVKEVAGHLTVAGDVVKVEVTGSLHFDNSTATHSYVPSYRCEAILDASDGPTRQSLFRRLSQVEFSPKSGNGTTLLPAPLTPTSPLTPASKTRQNEPL